MVILSFVYYCLGLFEAHLDTLLIMTRDCSFSKISSELVYTLLRVSSAYRQASRLSYVNQNVIRKKKMIMLTSMEVSAWTCSLILCAGLPKRHITDANEYINIKYRMKISREHLAWRGGKCW